MDNFPKLSLCSMNLIVPFELSITFMFFLMNFTMV